MNNKKFILITTQCFVLFCFPFTLQWRKVENLQWNGMGMVGEKSNCWWNCGMRGRETNVELGK